ncbi:hypothetical protein AH716_004384 [Salmonella enterica subsp. enterica]|nr:hypothetical protein [Salmonella enterica subsp. enterica serovar Gbadago]EGK3406479.1 hypothetical protein [Salmonella enterica]
MTNEINTFRSLYDLQFKYLQSIACERSVDASSDGTYQIILVLSRYDDIYPKRMRMVFEGAIDVKIGDINGLWGMLIDIEDIKNNGLENIYFIVREIEYNTFSFMCKSFNTELIFD